MAPHPESDKQIMLELANTHPELPPPYAVFKTNAVSTSLSQGGLFPLLSRVNSSCRPNLTRPLWDAKDGVIRLWAGCDIAEGEELVRPRQLNLSPGCRLILFVPPVLPMQGWMYLDSYYQSIAERKAETLDVLGRSPISFMSAFATRSLMTDVRHRLASS